LFLLSSLAREHRPIITAIAEKGPMSRKRRKETQNQKGSLKLDRRDIVLFSRE